MLSKKQVDDINCAVQIAVGEALQTVCVRAHPSCLWCKHFVEREELCGMAGMRPPARVLVLGCPAYVPDDVPF